MSQSILNLRIYEDSFSSNTIRIAWRVNSYIHEFSDRFVTCYINKMLQFITTVTSRRETGMQLLNVN
jgi:hypothetical protein